MHKLVQAIIKDSLHQTTYRRWVIRVVRAFDRACSPVKLTKETSIYGERYLSHAQVCATLISQEEMIFPEAVRVLIYTGNTLSRLGQHKEVELLLERALMICDQQREPYQFIRGTSLSVLGELYYAQSRYSEAERLLEQALAIWRQQRELDHPSTAHSFHTLALVYMAQGKYEKAKQFSEQSLAIYKKLGGQDHPVTASSLSTLADLYTRIGKYRWA